MLHLMPILGAEKSKTAFYVAGALLVAWALIVSVGIGMRNDDFPANQGTSRAVIGLTVLLVLATAATAIVTSGGSTETTTDSSAVTPQTATTSSQSTAATTTSAATSASTSTTTSTAGKPTATSGTPTPSSSPAAAPSAPLQLAANPQGQLAFEPKQLTAKAGNVTIDFANASPVPHNVVIAQGSQTLGQTPIKTGSATLKVTLKPGTYTFYCAVPGHRQAGMEGTLTVS